MDGLLVVAAFVDATLLPAAVGLTYATSESVDGLDTFDLGARNEAGAIIGACFNSEWPLTLSTVAADVITVELLCSCVSELSASTTEEA